MRIVPDSTRSAHAVLRAVRGCLAEIPDGLVMVACSGGADSLALAAALADAARQTARPAGAIIVDHHLQVDSATVANRAAQQCRSLGLAPVGVVEAHVGEGPGPEAAARSARYQVLEAQARSSGAVAVLLGHSLDDQAETVLLGLNRGSGTRALAGMPAHRGLYRRPLLGLRRATMAQACEHWALSAWHDPHNQDQRYRRVRVRENVLPQLEREIGPGIVPALARTALLARADADALDFLAGERWELLRADSQSGLAVAALAELPQALRTRIVRLWLIESAAAWDVGSGRPEPRDVADRTLHPTALTSHHLLSIDRLIADWRGQGALALPGGLAVGRQGGRLRVAVTVREPGNLAKPRSPSPGAKAPRRAATQLAATLPPTKPSTQSSRTSQPPTREACDGR